MRMDEELPLYDEQGARRRRMEIPNVPTQRACYPDAILDQLLVGADAKMAFDPNGLIDQLKKALADRALKAAFTLSSARAGPIKPYCSAGLRSSSIASFVWSRVDLTGAALRIGAVGWPQ
jgi:hypothetical protein